jgi:hypothetical protein
LVHHWLLRRGEVEVTQQLHNPRWIRGCFL